MGWTWRRRNTLLVLAVWMAVSGGSLYAFGAFQNSLREMCELNAAQLDLIYAAGQARIACISDLFF